MFTGIVEELGSTAAFERRGAGARLRVRCSLARALGEGASIAVNGVCLTAVEIEPDSFAADLAPETLARTNLGSLQPGAAVNLERPATPSTMLSGHIVQGHVDATAEIAALEELGGGNWWLTVRVPAGLGKYIVHKGSIAIDGISLTVAALEGETAAITIIPHTFQHTTLGSARPGTRVNLEVDVLAKYLEKLLDARRA